jgi:hypothetical protein
MSICALMAVLKEQARASRQVPDGCELVAVPDPDWQVDPGKRCRLAAGFGMPACGQPSAASMWRGHASPVLWAYCPEHMCGRWVQDGQVWHWIASAAEAPPR